MKRLCLIAAVVLLSLTTTTAQQQVLDRIAAVVDNDVILDSEVNAQVQFLAMNNHLDAKTPGLRDQVLQNMINERLMIAKAVEDSVVVSDDEVQQQLDATIQQRIRQVGSESRLEELYGMPISRIKREYRDEMRKSLIAQRLQQQKFGNASIGRFEVEKFYDTYKDSLPRVAEELLLSRLFLSPKATRASRDAARAKAQIVLDSINAGSDFASLARRFSQDPGSAQQGGELPLVRRGEFVKEFEAAVFSMNEGQISPIIETEFGFHVIQLIQRRGDAVKARHVLIRTEKSAESDSVAVATLDSIRAAVKAGTLTFAEAAKRYSEDKETNLIGGNLGAIEIDQLDKTWLPAINEATEGQLTKPFRITTNTAYGYQIVLVRKRTAPHAMTLESDYHKIETLALNYKRTKDMQAWLDDLRKRFYWKINS
jgi:peptidyl-prolyl cis-trans isomerase SurA